MTFRYIAILVCTLLVVDKPSRATTVIKQLQIVNSWPAVLQNARTNGHRDLEIRLNDGETLKGLLTDVRSDSCVLDGSDQDGIVIPYDQVWSIQWRHNAFSRGARFALIFAIAPSC